MDEENIMKVTTSQIETPKGKIEYTLVGNGRPILIVNWKRLQEERKKHEEYQAQELAKLYPELKTENSSGNKNLSEKFSTTFFDEQIIILHELNQYGR